MNVPVETESARQKRYINEMFDGLEKMLEEQRSKAVGAKLERIVKNIVTIKAKRLVRLAEVDEKALQAT